MEFYTELAVSCFGTKTIDTRVLTWTQLCQAIQSKSLFSQNAAVWRRFLCNCVLWINTLSSMFATGVSSSSSSKSSLFSGFAKPFAQTPTTIEASSAAASTTLSSTAGLSFGTSLGSPMQLFINSFFRFYSFHHTGFESTYTFFPSEFLWVAQPGTVEST
ncbi:hypothetical protein PIB30_026463 [Stylosanthes scabra]|uniref:Uncharacterized protein n=1 Tax=Stylosanthes scabra TaxID=79078 RepID=A0ABU6VAM7_9FABA|nr:hypothetical protein [Stylosanthes scabra]